MIIKQMYENQLRKAKKSTKKIYHTEKHKINPTKLTLPN